MGGVMDSGITGITQPSKADLMRSELSAELVGSVGDAYGSNLLVGGDAQWEGLEADLGRIDEGTLSWWEDYRRVFELSRVGHGLGDIALWFGVVQAEILARFEADAKFRLCVTRGWACHRVVLRRTKVKMAVSGDKDALNDLMAAEFGATIAGKGGGDGNSGTDRLSAVVERIRELSGRPAEGSDAGVMPDGSLLSVRECPVGGFVAEVSGGAEA